MRTANFLYIGLLAVLVYTFAPMAHAQSNRNIYYYAGFESGQVQQGSSPVDGMYVVTLTQPQVGDEFVSTGMGGAGPTTNLDTKVVRSEVVGGQTVLPRSGNYFMRSAIYYTKDYLKLNSDTKDKPRSGMYMYNAAHAIDFDEEVWMGFSIFLPSNFEHENGIHDHRGGNSLIAVNADTDSSFFLLHPYVPPGDTVTHWFLYVQTNDKSVYEADSNTRGEWLDLGTVASDLGKWTDFVIRYRANPFSVATNPATQGMPNSVNKTFQGNRGILQLWKSSGSADASGARSMVQKINRVNVPIGLVPRADQKLRMDMRMYKYGWKYNPTTVTGPVWVGFDEMRWGITSRDGTGFSDVAPSGASAPSGTTPPPTTPSTCTNQQTSTASIPTGYGASYNPLTSAREYLVQAACTNTTSATITAGNGNPLTYVYNRGYYYSGTAWTPYTLTCASGALIGGAWCPGRATASIPLPQNPTNVIAYTCQYTNSTWKCGCRDATCSTAYWQLQRVGR